MMIRVFAIQNITYQTRLHWRTRRAGGRRRGIEWFVDTYKRFCPSLCSLVHQVNACVCFIFHCLFYVVLIILLLSFTRIYLLWSPLPVVFIPLFCWWRTAMYFLLFGFLLRLYSQRTLVLDALVFFFRGGNCWLVVISCKDS